MYSIYSSCFPQQHFVSSGAHLPAECISRYFFPKCYHNLINPGSPFVLLCVVIALWNLKNPVFKTRCFMSCEQGCCDLSKKCLKGWFDWSHNSRSQMDQAECIFNLLPWKKAQISLQQQVWSVVVSFSFWYPTIAMTFPDSCDSSGVQLRARAGGRVQNWFKSSRKERSDCKSELGVLAAQCGTEMGRIWGCRCGSTRSQGREGGRGWLSLLPRPWWCPAPRQGCQLGTSALNTGSRASTAPSSWERLAVNTEPGSGRQGGEMRTWIAEFTEKQHRNISNHSWESVAQEQQGMPCLCPAPGGISVKEISFGVSFHLGQQGNDPNSRVMALPWEQPCGGCFKLQLVTATALISSFPCQMSF